MQYDMAGGPLLPPEEEEEITPSASALIAPPAFQAPYSDDQKINPRRMLWGNMLVDMGNMFGSWNGAGFQRPMTGAGIKAFQQAKMQNAKMDAANQAAQRQSWQDQNAYAQQMWQREQKAQPDLTTKMKEYQLAQQQGYGGDFMKYLEDTKTAGVTINTGQGGALLTEAQRVEMGLPQGTYWNHPVSGPKKVTGFTEGQVGAAQFANMMVDAEQKLTAVTEQGFDPTELLQHGGVVAPEALANFLRTPAGQQYRQAQEQWVRAKLRKESGAVIGADEMRDEIKTFFPQPGDSPEVLKQKRSAREQAVRGIASESGGFYDQEFGGLPEPEQAEASGLKQNPDGSYTTEDGRRWTAADGPEPGVFWMP